LLPRPGRRLGRGPRSRTHRLRGRRCCAMAVPRGEQRTRESAAHRATESGPRTASECGSQCGDAKRCQALHPRPLRGLLRWPSCATTSKIVGPASPALEEHPAVGYVGSRADEACTRSLPTAACPVSISLVPLRRPPRTMHGPQPKPPGTPPGTRDAAESPSVDARSPRAVPGRLRVLLPSPSPWTGGARPRPRPAVGAAGPAPVSATPVTLPTSEAEQVAGQRSRHRVAGNRASPARTS
jgi:hypothetical protein